MLLDFMKRATIVCQNSLLDKVKRIQELRRSNAAQPVRNKKKYRRKIKHKRRVDLTEQIGARKGEGAQAALRQVDTHSQNCDIHHKNNLRHAEAKMEIVSSLVYNSDITKRKENNAKYR